MSRSKKQPDTETCEACFQIRCKKCQWIATDQDVFAIQQGQMSACPVCGWKPGEEIN